ncbi:D-fructose 1,6-bisphosphatase class 2/sedoheptulose 1,7-bisphosphatase [Rubrobacter xylanophilus DSM 9941]|uniref:fructose-bisphosphatase class II n=1 Tax=Rubrobacter xylanophilus TaxID=49319 RepID=UPI001C63C6B9|nr:fructose-bisphosphatase class II [Rubrobacter xylanophilus]QYJ14926.1 D-fructose 1,6-bisphosphatase class 2/sedoheptulose 1,7-bisphosphatase [Rubrobacter xylanophilus DSM 9941]
MGSRALEYAAVTERVALGVARLEGSGDAARAYSLATETFREELSRMPVAGRVALLREQHVDERGRARSLRSEDGPGVLRTGDVVGSGEVRVDLAVEPVEGLSLLVKGQQGAISAVAAAPEGTMLRMPDMYMSKLIVGPRARGHIDIDAPAAENVEAIAAALGRKASEITVVVLDRDRHRDLIEEIRRTGARIHMRPEGDLTPSIAVGLRDSDVHAVIGIGGAPEGVLAAAVVKCLGGEIQARMWPVNRAQVQRLREFGLGDPERKLTTDDLIRGQDVVFAATGLTSGETLEGVRYFRGGGRTHTVVMSTRPRMIRFIDTIHALEPDAGLQGFQR